MIKIRILSILLLLSALTFNQAFTQQYGKSAIKSKVNLSDPNLVDYAPETFTSKSISRPGGNYATNKAIVDSIRQSMAVQIGATKNKNNTQALGPAPLLSLEFQGNNSPATPNDNDVAIGNNGFGISVLNSNLRIFDSVGNGVFTRTLSVFARSAGDFNRAFDPRVSYDPIRDRFIVVFLNGTTSRDNNPVLCFSASNDPTGLWYCYTLPGNPLNDTSWSDYPIISISDQDLFLTLNLLRDSSGWKDGFRQSIIWQIALDEAYKGDSLQHILWKDIKFNNQPLWSICPAQGGLLPSGPESWFISVRPSDISNDSVFVHQISNSVKSGNAKLSTRLIRVNQPYGIAPSAKQPSGQWLETNDARVLSAVYQAPFLHFAGNARNQQSNRAGIYYARWYVGEPDASLVILSSDTLEFGYPDIAYAGKGGEDDPAVMITFSHVGVNTQPGTSVAYFNYSQSPSEVLRVRQGVQSIDVLVDTFERWGDYTGIQRKYNRPGEFWLSGSYGERVNRTTIAKVVNADQSVNVPKSPTHITQHLYPNPSSHTVSFDFETNHSQYIRFALFDAQGKEVLLLLEDFIKAGKNHFSFNADAIAGGMYWFRAIGDQGYLVNKPLVISK